MAGGGRPDQAARCAYQAPERFTIQTTLSMTGTSMSTPATVASAAPDWKPNRLMAAATASSKKFEAYAMTCGSMPALRIRPSSLREVPQAGLW